MALKPRPAARRQDEHLDILLVVPTFPPDQCGVGDYTAQLAAHLHARGHRVGVLTTRRDVASRARCAPANDNATQPAAQLAPPFDLLPLLESWHFPDMRTILDVVRERSPDIVHIQYHNEDYDSVEMISTLPLCLKEILPGTRIVTTLHNTRSFTFEPRLTMGVLLRFSDWLIVTNENDRALLRAEHPSHAHKDSVVPAAGGMPCPPSILAERDALRTALRRELQLADDELLLAYFGFVNPEKGLESVLHAMAALHRERFPARLLLIGGLHSDRESDVSPYRDGLLDLARTLDVESRIISTGYLDAEAASRHLVAADLALLPFRDGLTTKRSSFLSVLSHDVPVLSTSGEHLPAALRNGENVFLVPASDAATTGLGLADAVRALGRDRARLEHVRAGGRILCEQVFGWGPIVAAHEEIYQRTRGQAAHATAGAVTSKLVTLGEAGAIMARLRAQGKTIVLGGGCFDLLHVGHIRYLRAAKAAGDVLVVALNSDQSVRKLKGPDRPLLDERERAEILAEFGFVDYVVVFDEDTAENVLLNLRPHFYAKGTDYTGQDVPGTADFLRTGGRLLFVGDDKTRSSSGYLDRLRDV